MLPKTNPIRTKAWSKLQKHKREMEGTHLREWFLNDSMRFKKFSLSLENLLVDFSKNRITQQTIELLKELFEECGIKDAIRQEFSGKKINETENRAVLHTALRNFSGKPVMVDGQDVMPEVKAELKKMKDFSERLISGEWKGFSGKRITDVVNIGIGGSDLGPAMAYDALRPFHVKELKVHFVSNVDGAHLAETIKDLTPATTLFIISSKSFTTQETMANAHAAKEWFLKSRASQKDVAKHFVAVSTNEEAVAEFGIDPRGIFVFWDWVGGRYSLWSSIGLSLCCGIGYKNFKDMLKGAHHMDEHFRHEPFEQNIPLLMAAIGIWYTNFWGAESEAIVPYAQNLHRFAAYFQQANMESNGKNVDRSGNKVDYNTGPVVWGEPGTNGQHAFFQLLHQGTRFIPIDFIGFARSFYPYKDHHTKLTANLFAQSEALMKGRTLAEVQHEIETAHEHPETPYKVFEGNRPSTTIMAPQLDPYYLGMLIAAYEHKIFAQGVVWNIFSFDQWGVELGKKLAKKILDKLHSSDDCSEHDNSTAGLIKYFRHESSALQPGEK